MKHVVLKDYYEEDRLIVDDEWYEHYEGLYGDRVKDFNELLFIYNSAAGHKHLVTHHNIIFKNLGATGAKLDEIARTTPRFAAIMDATILGWIEKDIACFGFGMYGFGLLYEDLSCVFNAVCNNIHYGRITEECIAVEYPFEGDMETADSYYVPQILIDELGRHRKTK